VEAVKCLVLLSTRKQNQNQWRFNRQDVRLTAKSGYPRPHKGDD